MTSKQIRRQVRRFRKELAISQPDSEALSNAAHQLGYAVIWFNQVLNEDNVQQLLESLSLTEHAAGSRGFTYADKHYRLLFVHEGLNPQETALVLAHELGHIYLGHMGSRCVIGNDVQEEFAANEFAHFLLHPGPSGKFKQFLKQRKKALIAISAALLILTAGCVTAQQVYLHRHYYGHYYVTATGQKYHLKDCHHIGNKDTVHRYTAEEHRSGKYDPCQICLP